jgi:hypothetical protein
LTIVLAVGVTQNWRTALLGLAAGVTALLAVTIGFGPGLVHLVPLDSLRRSIRIGTLKSKALMLSPSCRICFLPCRRELFGSGLSWSIAR